MYSIGEFAELLGITTKTLRNWDKSNKLKPHHRTVSGYRYYSQEQLEECLQQDCRAAPGKEKDFV